MDVCVKIKTYRHNFSKNFMDEISIFSKIHQYDDRQTFKDEYMKWYSENVDLIDKEKRLLKNNEYCGNIDDKIYFACRYYFRKKSNKIEDEEKKKKKFISNNTQRFNKRNRHIHKGKHISQTP